jgi:hypothetical protein
LKNPAIAKMWDLLIPSPESVEGVDRDVYERFAIPHAFKPRLSLFEACVAAFAALIRIFFGSLLFAVWGTYSLKAWTSIPNILLRVAVVLPMLVVFLLSFALLMIAISAVARAVSPKHL